MTKVPCGYYMLPFNPRAAFGLFTGRVATAFPVWNKLLSLVGVVTTTVKALFLTLVDFYSVFLAAEKLGVAIAENDGVRLAQKKRNLTVYS
ncbi:hypothetical protein ABMA58_07850 [Oceanospirillum sp. HFRX-1_2]